MVPIDFFEVIDLMKASKPTGVSLPESTTTPFPTTKEVKLMTALSKLQLLSISVVAIDYNVFYIRVHRSCHCHVIKRTDQDIYKFQKQLAYMNGQIDFRYLHPTTFLEMLNVRHISRSIDFFDPKNPSESVDDYQALVHSDTTVLPPMVVDDSYFSALKKPLFATYSMQKSTLLKKLKS
jgi:hypothetical protein